MEYKYKDANIVKEGQWNERTCIRREGGYNVDLASLPNGMKIIPKGAFFAVKESEGVKKAVFVKTAIAHASAESGATSLQVEKGHSLAVGEVVNGSTISKIATTASDYDTLTVSALSEAVTAGDALSDGNAKDCAGMCYASVVVDSNPTITLTLQAYEIDEDTLPYPASKEIKNALTSRHAFRL